MFKYIKSSFKGGSTKPLSLKGHLGSTDAAPKVPLPCPTRRDAATRIGRRCPRVPPHPATSCHMDSTWFSSTRADTASTWTDSPEIRPIQAEIQKEKKKKKGAERTVWLNTKPYFSPVSLKRQNTSPHISSHFTKFTLSLCSLPLCLCFVSLVASILYMFI